MGNYYCLVNSNNGNHPLYELLTSTRLSLGSMDFFFYGDCLLQQGSVGRLDNWIALYCSVTLSIDHANPPGSLSDYSWSVSSSAVDQVLSLMHLYSLKGTWLLTKPCFSNAASNLPAVQTSCCCCCFFCSSLQWGTALITPLFHILDISSFPVQQTPPWSTLCVTWMMGLSSKSLLCCYLHWHIQWPAKVNGFHHGGKEDKLWVITSAYLSRESESVNRFRGFID